MLLSEQPSAKAPERRDRDGAKGGALDILMIAHRFPPFMGGVEMHTFEVGRRMVQQGHRVRVLTGNPGELLPADEVVEGMRVRRVAVFPKTSDIYFAPRLVREIKAAPADIIHIQGFHTFMPPLACWAAISARTPFVMTFHSGGHSSPLRNLVRGVQRAAFRPLIARADKLIGVSQFEASLFSRGLQLPLERFKVVPNGAEIKVGAAASRCDPLHPLILSVGRLERYKGHHRALMAFVELRKQRPGARLRIVGEGPFKSDLFSLTKRFGLENSVSISGIPPDRRGEMAELMASANVVVLLSDYEAHPVAALEAISLGARVLASHSTGYIEMAEQGLVQTIALSSSPAATARALLNIVDDPGRASTRPAIADWNDCTRTLVQIYRQVLAARSGGSLDAPAFEQPAVVARR